MPPVGTYYCRYLRCKSNFGSRLVHGMWVSFCPQVRISRYILYYFLALSNLTDLDYPTGPYTHFKVSEWVSVWLPTPSTLATTTTVLLRLLSNGANKRTQSYSPDKVNKTPSDRAVAVAHASIQCGLCAYGVNCTTESLFYDDAHVRRVEVD